MIIYELTVDRQNLLGADKFSIAAESNKTVGFRFHFDRSWRIFDTKAAVFKDSDGEYYVIPVVSNCVTVPWEVLRTDDGFDLAVVAYENEVVLTTKKVEISVSQSLLPSVCTQLTSTSTLFDSIKNQLETQVRQEVRNEINALNATHANEMAHLSGQIEAAQANTQTVAAQKDSIIAQLNQNIASVTAEYQEQIEDLQSQLAVQTAKGDKWDLVNKALSEKVTSAHALWTGGTGLFALPDIDTSSMVTFNATNFSINLTEIGLDLSSVTSFSGIFNGKSNLTKIRLKNTNGLVSMIESFEDCRSMRFADIGNIEAVTNISELFNGCGSLEKVVFTKTGALFTMAKAFYNCVALKEIDGELNTMLCTSFPNAFIGCLSLEKVRFTEKSIRANIDFGSCIRMTKEGFMNILTGLSDSVTATVCFNQYALDNAMTSTEKAQFLNTVRNEKGWTVSFA